MKPKTSRLSCAYTLASALCGLLAVANCGSGGGTASGTGGHSGTGGGSGGSSVGAGGASVGGHTGAGGAITGAGGTSADAGTGGSSPDGGTGGGTGGSTSGAGGSGVPDGGADAGPTNCAGHAIAFNANVATNGDPAMARVMVNFGTPAVDLPLGNTPRTIEFWAFVRNTSWVGDANTMFEYGVVATNQGFGLDFGAVAASIDPYTNGSFDNDNQPSGVNATLSQWVHFAMTWDGGAATPAVRAYVNGVLRATRTSTQAGSTMLATAQSQLTIGGNPRGSYFNGYMDEFRVWNVARSATEITSTMNKTLAGTEPGLVGYWKFDETNGTTAADSVTGGGHTPHPGTLMANPATNVPTFIIPSPLPPINCP
jgi:Concanavalin A-like lectin/glucanases superfamily